MRPAVSAFPRPDGIRQGVGIKPPRAPTVVVSSASNVIDPAFADVVRVLFSDGTGAVLRFGGFDGKSVALICLENDLAARIVNDPAGNVALDLDQLVDDWVPEAGDTISLVWDARAQLWRETARTSLI